MQLLWVMQKDGKTRSHEGIQKSLKQVVVTPFRCNDMKDQLRIYICVLFILFEKESLLTRSVTRFHSAIIDYSSELKYKLDANRLLAAKTLLAINQDIQRWLKECKKFKTREEVNDRIPGDLPDIVTHRRVQKQIFFRSPSCFQQQRNAGG